MNTAALMDPANLARDRPANPEKVRPASQEKDRVMVTATVDTTIRRPSPAKDLVMASPAKDLLEETVTDTVTMVQALTRARDPRVTVKESQERDHLASLARESLDQTTATMHRQRVTVLQHPLTSGPLTLTC